jgi:hypothetical protein
MMASEDESKEKLRKLEDDQKANSPLDGIQPLVWSIRKEVDLTPGVGFLYFARIVDSTTGVEHRYVGQSKRGETRLREYRRNVERIFSGLPRRTTPGQERYRVVHLAMAKACQFNWDYEFHPLENVAVSEMNEREGKRISELDCDLNAKNSSWPVEDYGNLCIEDLLGI